MQHDIESNDAVVSELSDDDLAEDVKVSDVEEAIVRARAGGATEQDISDLIANAQQGEHVGITTPGEEKDLNALAAENAERLAPAAAEAEKAAVARKVEEESVKAQAQDILAAQSDAESEGAPARDEDES